MEEPFFEKYRPSSFNELVGNKQVVEQIKQLCQSKNLPHLLFFGPPGTGKTTISLIIAREFFGNEFRQNFMEINASDDRGIDMIREQVKSFAKTQALFSDFKIVLLDESDSMTTIAQESLRRIMEKYAKSCRFILSCNYPEKIIPAVKSRTAKFGFNKIDEKDIVEKLKYICEKENINYTTQLEEIAKISNGDLRGAINLLQTSINGSDLNIDVGKLRYDKSYYDVIKNLEEKDFLKAKQAFQRFLNEGYDERDFIKKYHAYIISEDIHSKDQKAQIILDLAHIDYMLTQGTMPEIQLDSFFIKVINTLK